MKFTTNIKGLLLIFLIINSSFLTLCTELKVSRKAKRLTFRKSKKAKSKSHTKMEWSEWADLNLKLPIAFAYGFCDEFEVLGTVAKVLKVLLGAEAAADVVCDLITDEIPAYKYEGDTESTKLAKDIGTFTGSRLNDFVKDSWDNSEKEVEGEAVSGENTNEMCAKLDEINNENAKTEAIISYFSTTKLDDVTFEKTVDEVPEEQGENEDYVSSSLRPKRARADLTFDVNPTISPDTLKIKEFVKNELRQCIESKIIATKVAYNKEQDKKTIRRNERHCNAILFERSARLDTGKLEFKNYYLEGATRDTILTYCNQEFVSEKIVKSTIVNACFTSLKNTYTLKKSQLKINSAQDEISDLKTKCASKENAGPVLVRLLKFVWVFLKGLAKCLVISLLTGLLIKGIKVVLGKLIELLTGGLLTVAKVLWYLGKFMYYLMKAMLNDEGQGKNQAKQIAAKREKAENYGRALASVINIILSIAAKKKRANSMKKKMRKMRKLRYFK